MSNYIAGNKKDWYEILMEKQTHRKSARGITGVSTLAAVESENDSWIISYLTWFQIWVLIGYSNQTLATIAVWWPGISSSSWREERPVNGRDLDRNDICLKLETEAPNRGLSF